MSVQGLRMDGEPARGLVPARALTKRKKHAQYTAQHWVARFRRIFLRDFTAGPFYSVELR